jgi:UDP-GlcNAc:undecaprenyl-phosphate GlcNAc-1-phosphate transferase
MNEQRWLLLFAAFAWPLAISWCLTGLLVRFAPRFGLIDEPSARKVHTRPTPKGGGLAIFVALVVVQCFPGFHWSDAATTLGLGAIVVVLGLIDDRRPLPWQWRLLVQTLVALAALIMTGQHLWGVGSDAANAFWLPWPLALIWIVGLINAFNMLDNMDALSAGVAWIVAAFLPIGYALRASSTMTLEPILIQHLMFLGALTGFLWFNWPPARIFMGDAGSTFLGFFLGLKTLQCSSMLPSSPTAWAFPILVLAIPLYDASSVVFLRLLQGRSPFHADKQHLSHRLTWLGWSSPGAVRVIYALGVAMACLGLVSFDLPSLQARTMMGFMGGLYIAALAIEYMIHRYHRAELNMHMESMKLRKGGANEKA